MSAPGSKGSRQHLEIGFMGEKVQKCRMCALKRAEEAQDTKQ